MPYLPVDLDGKRKAEEIERALGLPRLSVVGGNVDLWEAVWRAWSGGKTPEEAQYVDDLALGAAYGPDLRIRAALVARDFLEVAGDRHRVRGAMKWLFGLEGKKRGGKASSGNLNRGSHPGVQPGAEVPQKVDFPAKPGPMPEDTSRHTPRLFHPAPSTQHPDTKQQKLLAADPISALGGLNVPSVVAGAEPDRRAQAHPPPKIRKPTKDPDLWDADDFWNWAQSRREEGGLVPELKPQGRKLADWYRLCLNTEGVNAIALKHAFNAYGKNAHWDSANHPFSVFMSQWRTYARKEDVHAVAG